MADRPLFHDVPVQGGSLRVARWPGDGPPVLAIHGITASSISIAPLARALTGIAVLAPDLRGRGGSAGLPAPFGLDAHVEDCAAVIDAFADGQPVRVVGESMGGFVAVHLAAQRPELVAAVVLVDGGLPLPVPEGADVDALLHAILGPALARLDMTFPSLHAYLDYWRAHPALHECWNADVEAYLAYDLTGEPPALRSRVDAAAVMADGADTLRSTELAAALAAVACPISLLRAPRDLANQPSPLIPDSTVSHWSTQLPQMDAQLVEGTNHYSIVFGDHGANAIAEAVRTVGSEEVVRR